MKPSISDYWCGIPRAEVEIRGSDSEADGLNLIDWKVDLPYPVYGQTKTVHDVITVEGQNVDP
jgi:hypothetical protein